MEIHGAIITYSNPLEKWFWELLWSLPLPLVAIGCGLFLGICIWLGERNR